MSILKKISGRISHTTFGSSSVPLALLFVSIAAYGLLLPQMGFYWDDWPWMWFAHVYGDAYLLQIDRAFRPLAGVILWLCSLLAGQNPLIWQALTLGFRWLSAWSLYYALTCVWPEHKERAVWAAILFLVYPGYGHQYVAVNSSRHILPFAFFFTSIGLMVRANRDYPKHWWMHAGAIGMTILQFLSTDYYYGLELVRPLILWFAFATLTNRKMRLKKTLLAWIPYLAVLILTFTWRHIVSKQVNYPITLPGLFDKNMTNALGYTLGTIFQMVKTSTLEAWKAALSFPAVEAFGINKFIIYFALVVISGLCILAFLFHWQKDTLLKGLGGALIALGIAGLLVGGLPFLVTGLGMKLIFPANRMTLPMSFGASLLLVGLVDLVGWRRGLKIIVLSLMACIMIGAQFQTAVSFQRDWNYQEAFFRQLAWRLPGIKFGTAILSSRLQETHSTDDSLIAPLNWIYFPEAQPPELPIYMGYVEVRIGGRLPVLEKGIPLEYTYGPFKFKGSTDHALVVYYAPPACLRVMHPVFDAKYPHLPDLLAKSIPLSNLDQVVAAPSNPVILPASLFGPDPQSGWCYYFEKADLARQLGNWQEVVRLGEMAFQSGDSPNHASERAPFIQGFAYTSDWDRAVALTLEAIKINRYMKGMLCSLWFDIAQNTPESIEKSAAMVTISQRLGCQLP